MADEEIQHDRPRPVAKLRVDADKNRFVARGEKYGWAVLSWEPLILEQPEYGKQIQVEFNSAGLVTKILWLRGDELASMSGGGYVNMAKVLDEWFSWKPDTSKSGSTGTKGSQDEPDAAPSQ